MEASSRPYLKRLRPLFLIALGGLIVTEIVALSPSRLEEDSDTSGGGMELESLVPDDQAVLAPGIPKGRVPEYTVEKFNDVSVQGSLKQWNLVAERAFLYNHEKLVHAKSVLAYLYDPDGKATVIEGKEAKYFLNEKDLEIFGDVKTKFPDGFEVYSQYLRYHPNTKLVEIPTEYPVTGSGQEESGKLISFTSNGLGFAMGQSLLVLQENVHFKMQDPPDVSKEDKMKDDSSETTIESDHCVIHRDQSLAYFTMHPQRPEKDRFVHIAQPTLKAKGRKALLNYGDFSSMLHYLTVEEDVTIRELPKPPKNGVADPDAPKVEPRWGTGGRADFDNRTDVVILREYPQVYQGEDTITGDVITLHRDTDIVEVENSNAFSKGTSGSESP